MRAACWELLFCWAGTGAAVRPEGHNESFYIPLRAELERREEKNNMWPGMNFRRDFPRLSFCICLETMRRMMLTHLSLDHLKLCTMMAWFPVNSIVNYQAYRISKLCHKCL